MAKRFGGAPKCVSCQKSAYPEESVTYDKQVFHNACFRCLSCRSSVSIRNVAMIKGDLYCKNCFVRTFKTKGSYASFGQATLPKCDKEKLAADGVTASDKGGLKVVPSEAKRSPRNSPRNSVRNSPRNSPRNSVRNSPRNSPRNSVRNSPRSSPGNSARNSARNSPRNSPRSKDREIKEKENEKPNEHKDKLSSRAIAAKAFSAAPQSEPAAVTKKVGGVKMNFGGAPKCNVCQKAAYPEESQIYDGKSFHKACFKCLSCKFSISLSAIAMIQGDLYCKNCFMRMFKTKGSYGIFGDKTLPEHDKRKVDSNSVTSSPIKLSNVENHENNNQNNQHNNHINRNNKLSDQWIKSSNVSEPKSSEHIVPKAGDVSARAKVAIFQQLTPAASPEIIKSAKPANSSKLVYGGGGIKCTKCDKTVYPLEAQTYDGKSFHKSCFNCLTCKSAVSVKNVAIFEKRLYCKNCFVRMFKTKGSYGIFNEKKVNESEGSGTITPPENQIHIDSILEQSKINHDVENSVQTNFNEKENNNKNIQNNNIAIEAKHTEQEQEKEKEIQSEVDVLSVKVEEIKIVVSEPQQEQPEKQEKQQEPQQQQPEQSIQNKAAIVEQNAKVVEVNAVVDSASVVSAPAIRTHAVLDEFDPDADLFGAEFVVKEEIPIAVPEQVAT